MLKINNPRTTIIKKVKKRVPIKRQDESIEINKEKSDKEEQGKNREKEAKEIEVLATTSSQDNISQQFTVKVLPLREAIIFSEIIGDPRCKSRYRRRGTR